MAPSSAEQPPVSPTVADGLGDRQQLKDLLAEEDDVTMVVEMASSIQLPTSARPMNPLLLALACFGSWRALSFLLNRGDAQARPRDFFELVEGDTRGRSSNECLPMQQDKPKNPLLLALACFGSWQELGFLLDREDPLPRAIFDELLEVDVPAWPAVSLLEGVTVEEDTALHAVATCGDADNYLDSADVIYGKAKHLLFARNKKGDTSLHCAASAGKSRMVSHLIALARAEDEGGEKLKELLRKENGRKETALHEAVRIGNNRIVELLMEADSELGNFPEDGTSPLYLAILLEEGIIVQSLHDKSKGNLSYSGQNGQNALHAAVLHSAVKTKKLLEWNKSLTTQADTDGSTPLHFAASYQPAQDFSVGFYLHHSFPWIRCIDQTTAILPQVFEASPAALYRSDNRGLFPIHVAASVGAEKYCSLFIQKCPSSAGLRDARGRTFLHVAAEKKRRNVVSFACRNPSLAWILNMQDNDGNTALHLAVQAGGIRMICSLLKNRQVRLNLTNDKGQTPLGLSQVKTSGRMLRLNTDVWIRDALTLAGAKQGACRPDHFQEKYIPPECERKESKRLRESSQSIAIVSVLIATVTFGATFALPGGYRADDHANGGTPTLAGRYAFDAFMMANTLAFICSSIATIGTMFSGISTVDLSTRKSYYLAACCFSSASVTSLSAAFALGAYLVLSPVAPNTAKAICVISALVALCDVAGDLLRFVLLALPLWTRMGLIRASCNAIRAVTALAWLRFWQFIVIFIWATYARNNQHH